MKQPAKKTARLLAVGVATATIAVACDVPTPVQVGSPPGVRAWALADLGLTTNTPLTPPVRFDDIMENVGRRAPGFAGIRIDDDGNMVLMHTKGADVQAIEREVRARIAPTTPRRTAPAVRFEETRYTFAELANLKRAVNPYQFRVLSVDIDEVRNRLVLGVASAQQAAAVRDAISALGQSLDGILVEVVKPPIPATLTLQDSARPVIGGLKFTMYGVPDCTLGPNTRFGTWTTRYAVINSHCTSTYVGYDGGAAHQPFVYNPWSTYFGAEVMDPSPYYGYPMCPTGQYCREADVALIQFENTGESAFKIARTTEMVTSPGTEGPITRASPDFVVIDTFAYANLLVGQYLHKVGQRTGWSFGAIGTTCYDIWRPEFNAWVMCSFKAAGTVTGGDSGSPVFVWWAGGSGYDAGVAGILWGSAHHHHYIYIQGIQVSVGDTLIFSPWRNVMWDLGSPLPFP